MNAKNLLANNLELNQKYLGVQNEAFQLSLLVNRIRDYNNLTEESILIMLNNFEELYSIYTRAIQNEAILCICRLLDKKEKGFGLEKLHFKLSAHVNKLKKKNTPLFNDILHSDFNKRLKEIFELAYNSSMRIRDRRDNFLAHNSPWKIQATGVSQLPTIESVSEFQKKYKPSVTFEEIEKCSQYIFNYFVLCHKALFDSELFINDIISRGDLRELLFSLKELKIRQEIDQKDYEKKFKIRCEIKNWSPFKTH